MTHSQEATTHDRVFVSTFLLVLRIVLPSGSLEVSHHACQDTAIQPVASAVTQLQLQLTERSGLLVMHQQKISVLPAAFGEQGFVYACSCQHVFCFLKQTVSYECSLVCKFWQDSAASITILIGSYLPAYYSYCIVRVLSYGKIQAAVRHLRESKLQLHLGVHTVGCLCK